MEAYTPSMAYPELRPLPPIGSRVTVISLGKSASAAVEVTIIPTQRGSTNTTSAAEFVTVESFPPETAEVNEVGPNMLEVLAGGIAKESSYASH